MTSGVSGQPVSPARSGRSGLPAGPAGPAGPAQAESPRRAAVRGWPRRSLSAVRAAVPYLLSGAVTSVLALALAPALLLAGALSGLGLVTVLAPRAILALRWWAERERRRVAGYTGVEVAADYPPLDGPSPELLKAVGHPSLRRDAGWLAVHALTGLAAGILAVSLPLGAVNAFLVPFYWWLVPAGQAVEAPFVVDSWPRALAVPLVGVGYGLLALLLVPATARWQARTARRLLAPTPAAVLRARVAELAASRAAALEAHAAELRRVERDLHDGTQNRLVAVVMQLGIAERALRRDPTTALPLVLRAQDAASDALSGLRDVVRSIYPPILTERGLAGALRALAADCPVPCVWDDAGLRRAPAAVESAAYFGAAEALTNVTKHSGARHAELRVSTIEDVTGERLRLEVRDDGHGGAREGDGSGLTGIRRRVAALDGTLELDSPTGGPTVVRVELPCGS